MVDVPSVTLDAALAAVGTRSNGAWSRLMGRGTDVSVLGSDCSGQDVRLDNNLLDTAVDFGAVAFKQGQNVIAGAAVVAPNDGAPASATAMR